MSTASAATNRWALAFIFVTMFVDTIGLGMVIPVTPSIISDLTGEGMSGAAWYGGWLMFAFASMLFLCSPVIGNLSDRFGRRPILIVSLLAIGVDYTITGLAPTIGWLFVGRILSGIAGAAYTTANAYIADVSPPEKRAANFGLVGAAFGIGFVVGPALGGLLGHINDRLPFFAAAGLAVANAGFGYFVLKESLRAGASPRVRLAQGQCVGRACRHPRLSRRLRSRRRADPDAAGPRRQPGDLVVLCLSEVQLEQARRRLRDGVHGACDRARLWRADAHCDSAIGRNARGLCRPSMRRARLRGLRLRDGRLADVWLDAGVVADGARHAVPQRHHVQTDAGQRARRVAGRALEHRRAHLGRGAAA